MIRDIKEGVRKAMMDFQNASFVGGGGSSMATAQEGITDALASLNDERDYAGSILPKMMDQLKALKESFKDYAAKTKEALTAENGGKEYTEEDLQKDSNAVDEYQRILQKEGAHDNSALMDSL